MFIPQLFRVRAIASFAFALTLGVATYGFAATNTVGTSRAGDGDAAISGYSITNITYALRQSDPGLLDSVSFSITETDAPVTVKAQITESVGANTTTTWHSCSNTSGSTWKCDLTHQYSTTNFNDADLASLEAEYVTNLRVVAAE